MVTIHATTGERFVIGSTSDIAGLLPHIAVLYERAEHARRLAREIGDAVASQGLLQHAQEYERQAAELEARVAAMVEAAHNQGSE